MSQGPPRRGRRRDNAREHRKATREPLHADDHRQHDRRRHQQQVTRSPQAADSPLTASAPIGTSRSPVQCVRRRLRERTAEKRPGDNVPWIMDAGVDTRIRDERSESAQRKSRHGHDPPDPGGEREGSRRVSGGKCRRGRHGYEPRARHRPCVPVRSPATNNRLDTEIQDGGGDGNRRQAHPRGGATAASAGQAQNGSRRDREARVVRRPAESAEGRSRLGSGSPQSRRRRRGRAAQPRGPLGRPSCIGHRPPTAPFMSRSVMVLGRYPRSGVRLRQVVTS